MMRGLVYHSDWFSEHESAYDQILTPRIPKGGARALVVGTFEGRSVEWLLKNGVKEVVVLEDPVVKDNPSSVPCRSTRGVSVVVTDREVRDTLKRNLRFLKSIHPGAVVRLVEATLPQGLVKIVSDKKEFDVVVIDAQSSKHAMECAVVSFTVLKPGGTMVFTNYTHGRTHDASCPRRGIDGFLDAYVTDVRVLRTGFHSFIERRKVPIELPLRCHAEVSDPNPDPDPKKSCERMQKNQKIRRPTPKLAKGQR